MFEHYNIVSERDIIESTGKLEQYLERMDQLRAEPDGEEAGPVTLTE